MKRINVVCLLFVVFFLANCQKNTEEAAELIIYSTSIITLETDKPSAEAIAVKDGKILKVGTKSEVDELKGPNTKIIDVKDATIMPGFIEGHGHFSGLGNSLMKLNLMKTQNWSEIVSLVAEKAKNMPVGEWITGRGWHQEKWNEAVANAVSGYPRHDDLSAISTSNPVMLRHASGHALFANAKAMEIAGVTAATKDPEGGRILRDEKGNPIGVFEETAMNLIQDAHKTFLEGKSEADLEAEWYEQIELATKNCLENGITSFQDAGASFIEIERYKKMAEAGKLGLRLWSMISARENVSDETLTGFPIIGAGNDFFTSSAIKGYADGALGSYGAWLLEPYSDKANFLGQNVTPLDTLEQTARFAAKYNLQMCIHAIGDRANREILDMYEAIFNDNPKKADWRWRIEHAQHVNINDIPRFAALNVIPSMQGVHCTSDAPFVPKRLGEYRSKIEAYAWRQLMNKGSIIVNGTDAPVESVDPLPCFYSTVTRKMISGEAFYPEQAMTRLEALQSYTINNAYGAFEESIKGTIKEGKYADFAILDTNLLECDEKDILNTKVLMTIVNGEVKYNRKG